MSALKMMPQSPSSLQTFLTCPRQYFAKYIAKSVVFKGNKHTELGSKVHKFFEDYLNGAVSNLPPELSKAKLCLDNFKKYFYGAEVKVAITKENKITDWFSEDAYQRCIVDALLTNKDQSVIVAIDWKTGKKRDNQTQHDFIKKCLGVMFPRAKLIKTVFVYMVAGELTIQDYEPLTSSLQDLDETMKELETAYQEGLFNPKTSGLCNGWCEVSNCIYNKTKGVKNA